MILPENDQNDKQGQTCTLVLQHRICVKCKVYLPRKIFSVDVKLNIQLNSETQQTLCERIKTQGSAPSPGSFSCAPKKTGTLFLYVCHYPA
jgi:hypothetical protein